MTTGSAEMTTGGAKCGGPILVMDLISRQWQNARTLHARRGARHA